MTLFGPFDDPEHEQAALVAPLVWEAAIRQARRGDPSWLLVLLRDDTKIIPGNARDFFADLIEGKVKLRPLKLTFAKAMRRYARERQVVALVQLEMEEAGRQRDKDLRAELTVKWATLCGTTPAAVKRYLALPESRRRFRPPSPLRR